MRSYNGKLIEDKLSGSSFSSFSVADKRDALSAYDIAVNNGFVGSEAEWLQSLANASSAFTFNQATPASTWLITHGLGYYPNVSTFDESGDQIVGQVIHHSLVQVEIQFNSNRAGDARLS